MKRLVLFVLIVLTNGCTVQHLSTPAIDKISHKDISPNSSLLISIRYYDDWEFNWVKSRELASYFKIQSETANRIGYVKEENWDSGLPRSPKSRYKLKFHIFREESNNALGHVAGFTLGLIPVVDTVYYSAIGVLYDNDVPIERYSYSASEDTWISIYALFAGNNNHLNENVPRHFVKSLIHSLGNVILDNAISPRAI